MTATPMNVTAGATTLDFNALPEASQRYLAQKALNHLFANVADSKVAARAEAKAKADHDSDSTQDTAWKDLSDATRKAKITAVATADWKAGERAKVTEEFLTGLRDGTMGVRAAAARKTPEEKLHDEIVMEYVRSAIKAKAEKTGQKVAMPDGDALTTIKGRIAEAKAEEIAKEVKRRLTATTKATDGLADLLD